MSNEYAYSGNELDLFAEATQWKAYWESHIVEFIRGDVLEVGAGVGTNTQRLLREKVRRWVCLERDRKLAERICETVRGMIVVQRCEVVVGSLDVLDSSDRFDVILYIDVLEHIEDDRAEMSCAAAHLRAGGRLVILAPAHPWLFSRFDEAVGHYRRYSRLSLREATPKCLRCELLIYLDSVGLIASLANRFFLDRAKPTPGQIKLWDRVLVRCSRGLDPVLGYYVGKSILGVWQKTR